MGKEGMTLYYQSGLININSYRAKSGNIVGKKFTAGNQGI